MTNEDTKPVADAMLFGEALQSDASHPSQIEARRVLFDQLNELSKARFKNMFIKDRRGWVQGVSDALTGETPTFTGQETGDDFEVRPTLFGGKEIFQRRGKGWINVGSMHDLTPEAQEYFANMLATAKAKKEKQ
jgi:hypothetical protein